MTHLPASLTEAVSSEHRRDLRRAATREALASLARCCQPRTWHEYVRAVRTAFVARRRGTAACCA